jgi:hypothetical protein
MSLLGIRDDNMFLEISLYIGRALKDREKTEEIVTANKVSWPANIRPSSLPGVAIACHSGSR